MDSLKQHLRNVQSLDPDKRKKAVLGLAEENSIEALQALEKTARDDTNLEIRFLAKKALAGLKKKMAGPLPSGPDDGPGTDPLFHGDDACKIAAIKKAAAQKGPETLERLLTLIETEKSPQVRGTALLAVGLMADKSQIGIFSKYISDPDPNVRLNCVKALSYMDEAITYPLFVVALSDKTGRVASRAYGFLRKLGKKNIVSLLKTMAASRRRWMRKAVAKACGRLKTPEVIPILRSLAGREEGDVRLYALRSLKTLTELGSEQAQQALAEAGPGDGAALDAATSAGDAPPDDVAAVAGVAGPEPRLGEELVSGSRSVGFIIPSGNKDLPLNAESPADRLAALQDIVDEGDPSRLPEVLTRLRIEKNLKVKASLLAALGQLGGEDEVEHIRLYLEHPDARIRATAVEIIGRIRPDGFVAFLEPFLEDEDNRTAANAIVAIGGEEGVNVEPHLKRLADSDEVNHRKSALYAILQLEDGSFAGILQGLCNDEDDEVADRAREVTALLCEKGVITRSVDGSLSRSMADGDRGRTARALERAQARHRPPASHPQAGKAALLPSRIDLDKTDYLPFDLVPVDLLTACYYCYALASSLAVVMFGFIYISDAEDFRFGALLGIALAVPLFYVATALGLQAGKEWARLLTVLTARIVPLPGLAGKTSETLNSEAALDFFDSNPSAPPAFARAAAVSLVGLLVSFVVLLLL